LRQVLPRGETALVRKAARCSNTAFETLLDRNGSRLRMTVAKYIENSDDREDVSAEIVAKLLDNRKAPLRAWKPIASFGAYLVTIGVRHCLKWRAKRHQLRSREQLRLGPASEERDPAEVIAEMVAAPVQTQPEHATLRRETEEWVREGMTELSPRDQVLLKLRFLEGLGTAEIGRCLRITPNNANVAVFRALRRLERVLDADGADVWEA